MEKETFFQNEFFAGANVFFVLERLRLRFLIFIFNPKAEKKFYHIFFYFSEKFQRKKKFQKIYFQQLFPQNGFFSMAQV